MSRFAGLPLQGQRDNFRIGRHPIVDSVKKNPRHEEVKRRSRAVHRTEALRELRAIVGGTLRTSMGSQIPRDSDLGKTYSGIGTSVIFYDIKPR